MGSPEDGPESGAALLPPKAPWKEHTGAWSRRLRYLAVAGGAVVALLLISASLAPPAFPSPQQLLSDPQEDSPSLQQAKAWAASSSAQWSTHLRRALQSLAHTLLLCNHSPGSPVAFHTALCGPWLDSGASTGIDTEHKNAQSKGKESALAEADESPAKPLAHWLPLRWNPEEDKAEEAEIDIVLPQLPDALDTGFKAPPAEEPTASDSGPDSKSSAQSDSQAVLPGPSPAVGKRESRNAHRSIPAPLARHVAFPGPAQCGAWVSEYARLQREIRGSSAQSDNDSGREGGRGVRRKYLTYESTLYNPGLGDRLVGLVSSFLVALLTRRAFIMADPFLAAVFEPAEVDWRVRPDVPMPVTTSSMTNVSEGCVLRVYALNGLRSGIFPACPECRGMVSDIVENFEGTEPAANIVIHINRGVLTDIFRSRGSRTRRGLQAMGLQHRNAFGCILRFLMRPRREILQLAARPAQALLRPQARSICLHLRTDDDYAWPSPERLSNDTYMAAFRDKVEAHLEPLLQCAQRLEDRYLKEEGRRRPTWFVMSDAGAVTSAMVRRYGRKVLTSGFLTKHPKLVGITAMASSAVEWLLFSACDSYVIVESGLSKSAYAYNLRAPPLFMFDRLDLPLHVHRECDLTKPLSVLDLGNWSGL